MSALEDVDFQDLIHRAARGLQAGLHLFQHELCLPLDRSIDDLASLRVKRGIPEEGLMTNEAIHQLAQRLRIDSIRAAAAASSGHPTSSMSAADLMGVLMARHLHYNYEDPKDPNNDHLIFSKGHAAPLPYAMFAAAGAITDEELLTFRKFGSRLEGHPTPALPWLDVATGSLAQGMPRERRREHDRQRLHEAAQHLPYL